MALHANPSQWHITYLAVCHHDSNVHIYNGEHRITCKISRLKSSVLSTAFSLQVHGQIESLAGLLAICMNLQDPLFFAGCRNGTCLVWDARVGSPPVMSVKESPVGSRLSSSVIRLHPLQDHNYVISNALNSKVRPTDGERVVILQCMGYCSLSMTASFIPPCSIHKSGHTSGCADSAVQL